jgi:hypothetical protein
MSKYILTTDGELYHYGVKGQRWGVRRYQNKDGSLTPAGKKRAQQDANELKKAVGKTFDTYDEYRRSQSKHYVVDKYGANSYGPDGKPRFDTSRGVMIYNKKKLDTANLYSRKLDELERAMKERYDSVKFEGGFNTESGKASVKYTLEKNGHKTVAEFVKDYGEYEIPIKFVELK